MFVKKSQRCETILKVVLKFLFAKKSNISKCKIKFNFGLNHVFIFFHLFFLRHFLVSFTSKVFHLFFAWKEKSLPIQLKCSENHIRSAQIKKLYKIKKTKYWITKDSTENF